MIEPQAFEALASSTNGIVKLRELILDLAVRGLLVAQNPNDETANKLLEKIATEKQESHKKGDIRKISIKPMETIADAPFLIPKNWQWIRFGQLIFDSDAGWSPKAEAFPRSDDYWGVLKVSAVSWGKFLPNENKQLLPGIRPPESALVSSGDFLISRANTSELVARCVVVDEKPKNLILSDKIVRLKLTSHCNKGFLCFVNNSARYARNYYAEKSSGTSTSMKNVSRPVIYELPVPLPPLEEQNRIVAKVNELMALCDQLVQHQSHSNTVHQRLLQTLLESLTQAVDNEAFQKIWTQISANFDTLFTSDDSVEQLKQVILQLAVMGKLVVQYPSDEPANVLFEKINIKNQRLKTNGNTKNIIENNIVSEEKTFEIPQSWKWVRLGDFSEIKGGKRLPSGHSYHNTETPYLYIQVTNMKNGTIIMPGMKYISKETHQEIQRYTISKDDLYITIAGTIGEVGLVPNEFDGMNLTENAAKIVFNTINKYWLQKVLSSKTLQMQFTEKTNQLAQPKLALHRVASACIALPPLEEQHRIVAKVDELMAICDLLKSRINKAKKIQENLATAIVEKAAA